MVGNSVKKVQIADWKALFECLEVPDFGTAYVIALFNYWALLNSRHESPSYLDT